MAIVLHSKGLIFLKPRKVAGTSFEIALSAFASDDDIIPPISPDDERMREDLGFTPAQNFHWANGDEPSANQPLKYFNHIPAKALQNQISKGAWESCSKISIIRNPFDFMVSLYYWKVDRDTREKLSFNEFVVKNRAWLTVNNLQYQVDGRYFIDAWLKYDQLQNDIIDLERSMPQLAGLAESIQNIKAKSGYRDDIDLGELYRNAPQAFQINCNDCCHQLEKFSFNIPSV